MTTICKKVIMQACIILTFAALMASAGCSTPDASAAGGAANAPAAVAETQVDTNSVVECAAQKLSATNVVPAKIVYPDVTEEDFSVEDWAEELAEKAEQGIHIRNGYILILVRMPAIEGEYQSLSKVRAKFRAIEFLRCHYPDLPKEFSATCRVLVCDISDSGEMCIAVMAFSEQDILSATLM